jgi:hypothetical protein
VGAWQKKFISWGGVRGKEEGRWGAKGRRKKRGGRREEGGGKREVGGQSKEAIPKVIPSRVKNTEEAL